MEYLIQFQINVFALMILIALYVFVKLSKVRSFSKWLIRMTIVATIIAVIDEPLTWIFDKSPGPLGFYIEYMTNFILFLMAPIIAGLLASYVDYRIYNLPQRIFKRWGYQQVTIGTFILLLINIVYPIYFRVNPLTNGFSSGPFISFHYSLVGCFYLIMLIAIIKNMNRVSRLESLIFILFFLVPILSMIIGIFNSRLHLSWTSITFILLVIYIFLETAPLEEDFLTKIYNRASYEKYLDYLKQNRKRFGLMIIDLNGFKAINDKYGHKKGDDVLVIFSKALKNVFHKEVVIARLGGDEFAIVIEKNMDSIEERIQEIQEKLINHFDSVIQDLKFSYGYKEFIDSMTLDELFVEADEKMYINKSRRGSLLNQLK